MAVRKITEYPEKVLAEVGKPVTVFDQDLADLCSDMFETMYEAGGVGLAAPQIGLSLRLFVMDCEGIKLIAANPEIISTEGEPSEEVYWTTLLLVRVYGLCLRDRTLSEVVRRSRYDFAVALSPGRVIDRLLNRKYPQLKGSGAKLWDSKANRDAVSRLQEVYNGTT